MQTNEVPDVVELENARGLVRKYRICWEVSPEYAYVDGERREIGYVVGLYGTHDEVHRTPSPGCPECAPVQRALESIVAHVVPGEGRDSFYDVVVNRSSLQYSKSRGERPDVSATISILHRKGVNRPIDECESVCLKEIVAKLREVGACEGRWGAATVNPMDASSPAHVCKSTS